MTDNLNCDAPEAVEFREEVPNPEYPMSAVPRRADEMRAVVQWFGGRQMKKLMMPKNLSKGDRAAWLAADENFLVSRLRDEVVELFAELIEGASPERVISECSDVANFALMLADRAAQNCRHCAHYNEDGDECCECGARFCVAEYADECDCWRCIPEFSMGNRLRDGGQE